MQQKNFADAFYDSLTFYLTLSSREDSTNQTTVTCVLMQRFDCIRVLYIIYRYLLVIKLMSVKKAAQKGISMVHLKKVL